MESEATSIAGEPEQEHLREVRHLMETRHEEKATAVAEALRDEWELSQLRSDGRLR